MKISVIRIVGLAILLACAACKKKEPNDTTKVPDGSKPASKGAAGLPEVTPAAPAVKNAYAEKHWKLGEPTGEWDTKFEEAATVDEKIEVLGEKETYGPEDLPDLIRRALRHPDERLRIEAVQRTPGLVTTGKEAADVLSGAVYDESKEVRAYAMEMAREQFMDAKLDIYRNTIKAEASEVKELTAVELGRLSTKPAFEILMEGLGDSDPAFVSKVNEEIFLLVNQRFDSQRDAQNWWGGVSKNYDDRLNYTGE